MISRETPWTRVHPTNIGPAIAGIGGADLQAACLYGGVYDRIWRGESVLLVRQTWHGKQMFIGTPDEAAEKVGEM